MIKSTRNEGLGDDPILCIFEIFHFPIFEEVRIQSEFYFLIVLRHDRTKFPPVLDFSGRTKFPPGQTGDVVKFSIRRA